MIEYICWNIFIDRTEDKMSEIESGKAYCK